MHNPFSLSRLIPPSELGHEAITAVVLHADRIMLGTEKGSLLVFDLSHASTSSAPPAATLVSKHPGQLKKSIDQLGVIKELNALVCLSGGDVTLLSFPDLSPLSSFATQTKGTCSLFALSTEIYHPSTSSPVPEIHTTLALACRRRLLVLSWVDGTWNPQVETALPHQIRGMAFEGRKIVAGFSTGEYGIVSLAPLEGKGSEDPPTLGSLFSLPLPIAEKAGNGPKTDRGGGGLSNFGLSGVGAGLGALSGLALGKKLEKNGVVGVPTLKGRKGKMPQRSASGEPEKREDDWLWGKAWGWEDENDERNLEVLVVRDNIALPVSAKGKPRSTGSSSSSTSAINYPSSVDETIVLPPYVVSLLASPPPPPLAHAQGELEPPTLAINDFESLASVQLLAVPPDSDSVSLIHSQTARLLTASSSSTQPPILILTSPHTTTSSPVEQTLWIGRMESWEEQIEELGRQGKWEEAIRLLRNSPALTGRTSLPPPLLRRLSTLHALHLFKFHRYALAVDAFIRLDLSPAKVVALYPETISGKLFVGENGKEGLFGGRKKVDVEKEEAARVEREQEEQNEREDEVETNVSYSPAKRNLIREEDEDKMSIRSVSSRLTGKRSWLREREPSTGLTAVEENAQKAEIDRERQAKLDQKNYSTSIDELIRYLTDRRQKYSQALAALVPSSRPSPSMHRPSASPEELLSLPNLPLTELSSDQLARTAQVVDTALFRSYLATKPIMIGPLCRIENWCEVEEVEELLLQAKKRRELLDLYNGKSMHTKAVQLLRQMSDDEDDPEEKLGDTVRYLQKLGPDHLDVIFQASKWVFEQDKRAGLEIFVADLEEVESLPRHAVLAHLDAVDPEVCTKYLEHIVHDLGEQGSEFHEKLIELYLGSVRSAEKRERESTPSKSESYKKLIEFLEQSTSYRAERILGRLPSEDLHEVRAILLGRLGRHEGALQIYVYQIDDHATAEQYCKRVYESDEAMKSTIFPLLLRLYLRPRPSHPLLFAPALSLLSNHAARIDPFEAFELLPPLVSLGDMQTYLTKTLRRSTERRREAVMVKNVGRSWVEQNERDLVDLEERRVKISDSRVCPQCYKRIGNSVIAIHNPHGEVTHYQCREQFQEEKRSKSVVAQ
ncbi:Vam6p [Sporobolomyces salmoneus]|uniref:Vam6p n=1 Tax=Sporobolomyces salmoneus TaxID=183962 RepID=UPI00317B5B13